MVQKFCRTMTFSVRTMEPKLIFFEVDRDAAASKAAYHSLPQSPLLQTERRPRAKRTRSDLGQIPESMFIVSS